MNSYLSKPITFVKAPTIFCNSSKTLLIKFPYSFSRNKPSKNAFKPKLSFIKRKNVTIIASNDSTFSSSSDSVVASTIVEEEDAEATQLFEKLKDAEKQRINKLEELERKADLQLERQLVMASCWSRALLTMRGKLKGTEWDPENSHRIDFSDFMGILNSNNVQFMEYLNYGQTISVILPYYKDRKMDGTGGKFKE